MVRSRAWWTVGSRGPALMMVVVAVAGQPAPAPAAEVPEALRERVRTDHDREALHSLDFLLSVSLDEDQARAVLPLYEEACRLRLEVYERKTEIQREELEAYAAFLAEDRLNQGFSPEVERRAARANHQNKMARERLTIELNALADAVEEILAPGQRQIAQTYRPDNRAVFARFATDKDRRKAARRARRAPPPPSPDPQLAAARNELHDINKAIHPHQSPIAKLLLAPSAAEALYALAGRRPPEIVRQAVDCWRFGTRDYPLEQCRRAADAIRELRKEINNWNLVNGLHFSSDQIEQLVHLADHAERLKTVQNNARPREKLPRAVYNARLVELELAAEAVLRSGQREVLETYKPCLIPPKNLKDPVRVGQANDGSHLANWLAGARNRNEKQRERMIEKLIEREIDRLGPMDESAIAERRDLLRETVRTAARLSDIDFAISKDQLAQAIQPENRKNTLVAEIDELRRERGLPGRTSQFLLNPGFARVLLVRYAQLAHGARTVKADLAAGPKAPNCDRSCAVKREKR